MPTIDITDKFGLKIDVDPSPISSLAKYLKAPPSISAILHSVQDIRNLKISENPFTSQSLGLEFTEPVKLGSTGAELDIAPSLSGAVAVASGEALFDSASDPYGDAVAIPADNAYLSLGVKGALTLSGANSTGLLGFTNGTTVSCTVYRLFPASSAIADDLKVLAADFIVPIDVSDIEALPQGAIATVAGDGSITLSAEFDLPSSVNPLATVTDTFLAGQLKLSAGGSASVSAVFTFTGGYQVRVQRQAGRKFQIGVLKQRSSDFDVTVQASVSAEATALGKDWIETLLTLASSDPEADETTLKNAGLSADQIARIDSAIETGVERSLQLSISAELDAFDQSSTAFSYHVDLDAVDSDATGAAKGAIALALAGNFSALEAGGLSGVTPVRSVFSKMKQRKRILKVNILGIAGFASIGSLAQKGVIIVDQDSGAVTITDKTTASRIGFTTSNFAKDSAKLRQVLAESVIVTAAYHTAGLLPVAQFSASLWYFDFRHRTNLSNMSDYLNIAHALNVRSDSAIAKDLASLKTVGNQLGQSTFNVNTSYDDPLVRSLFLDATGGVRQQPEYENIARRALAALLPADHPATPARSTPLVDQAVWNEMIRNLDTDSTLTAFFGNHPKLKNFAAIMMSDLLLIRWWSSSMSGLATALAALLAFFQKNPKWTQQDPAFQQLHAKLNTAVRKVANDTKNDFREPLGLLSMDYASNQKAPLTAELASSKLSFIANR